MIVVVWETWMEAGASFGTVRVAPGGTRLVSLLAQRLHTGVPLPAPPEADPDCRYLLEVARLYRLVLGIVPDRPGLRHHADLLGAGSTLAELAASFLAVGGVSPDRRDTARLLWSRAGADPGGFEPAWSRATGLSDFAAELARRPPRSDAVLPLLFPDGVDPTDADAGPGWGYRIWAGEIDGALERLARRTAPLLRLFGPRIVLKLDLSPDSAPAALDASLRSVCAQLYGRWRLVLRGVAPIGWRPPADPRIVWAGEPTKRVELRGVLRGTLKPSEMLPPVALGCFALAALRRPGVSAWRSDEDRIDAAGRRSAPLLDRSRGLVLERANARGEERHLPAVLLHRSMLTPVASVAPADQASLPSVSLVIATRDRPKLLRRCVNSIRATTGAAVGAPIDPEIVLVDNGSDNAEALALLLRYEAEGCVVLRRPGAFNWSALCNAGVRASRGEVVVLLNNDVECFQTDWLVRLVYAAQQTGTGVAGAKLLFANGAVQHNGVLIGPGPTAAHRLDDGAEPETKHRRVSAVTGACLAMRRTVFDRLDGFEEALPVTWKDLDFCLRARRAGFAIVVASDCVLFHDELGTRTPDDAPENQAEVSRTRAFVKRRHGRALRPDRFLHPFLRFGSGARRLDTEAGGRVARLIARGGLH